jgi:hypothetical protein
MVDERPGVGSREFLQTAERTHQDQRGVRARDVTSGENERSHFGFPQRSPLELAISDPFVAREHDPAVSPGLIKPRLVRCAFGKVLGEALNAGARFAQGFYDRVTVERLVDEVRYRFKRL